MVETRSKKRKANIGGFGIVELIVGIGVLSIALYGGLALTQQALKVAQSNERNVQAAYLLEEGIELARFDRYNGWSPAFSPSSIGIFTRSTSFVDGAPPGLRWVRTTVSWSEGGSAKSRSLETYLSDL